MKFLAIALMAFVMPTLVWSYEVVEQGTKKIEVSVDGEAALLGTIQYTVLKVKAFEIFHCDDHPDDPMCEFNRYYYENAAFPFIAQQRRAGFLEAVFSTDPLESGSWDDIRNNTNESFLKPAVLVLYKGPQEDKVTQKILKDLAKKHLN